MSNTHNELPMIAVMAGTPVDTQMGIQLIDKQQYRVIGIPLSKTPSEQTSFQTMNPTKRYQCVKASINTLQQEGIQVVFVYCNSLSASVDFDKLASELDIVIITPLQVYQSLAMEYDKLGIMSANAQGLAGIERVLHQQNPLLQLWSIAMLPLVESIERNEAPQHIAQQFNFDAIVSFFEKNNVQGIVMGCTHFPYIVQEFLRRTSLHIIDPASYMLKMLSKSVSNVNSKDSVEV